MEPVLIDTVPSLQSFLESLPLFPGRRPELYIDLEGDDLCRRGTLSLVTIHIESKHTVHLIDVTSLRGLAFSTADPSGRTLKSILEDRDAVKVFFDIRNDSDALFSHYGVRVQGIEDVQLMELATRSFSKRLVNGLAKCIDNNPDIEYQERREWRVVKDRGQVLFRTAKDGYAVFDRWPLPSEVLKYCVQDVTFLPKLRDSYRAKLCNASWVKVQEETVARIALSQSSSYNGKGRHMALGPPAWQNWHPSMSEQRERSLLQEGEALIEEVPTARDAPAEPAAATTATAATADTSGRVREVNSIAEALSSMMERPSSPVIDRGDDSDEYDVGYSGGYRSYPSSSEQSPRDYTACDIECGYCGHCDY